MSVMVQIRNVPAELHQTFKARAMAARMSLSEYLLNEMRAIAERPTMAEMRARLASRSTTDVTTEQILEAVRLGRDER